MEFEVGFCGYLSPSCRAKDTPAPELLSPEERFVKARHEIMTKAVARIPPSVVSGSLTIRGFTFAKKLVDP